MSRCIHRSWIAPTLFALGAGIALADPMEDGQAAYNKGDYATALRLWRPLAEQGNARAENNLGVLYENAKGVPQDIREAVKWYRLAAKQGYAGAQNNLGLIYAIGRGGYPRNPIRAYMWFSLAASSLSGAVGADVAQSRDVFASAMTPGQIAQAKTLADQCQASHYSQCDEDSDAAAPDPTQSATVSTPAMATTSHAVTVADYPSSSIRLHESGEVTVTYVVTETGSVSVCTVLIPSGSMRLDDAACAMVKRRWKYKPATEDGKPVSVQYISRIVFPPIVESRAR